MIQHIVLLKWKDDTNEAQIDAAFAQAQELVDGIKSVQRVSLGRNRADDDHGYTHALIVKLSSRGPAFYTQTRVGIDVRTRADRRASPIGGHDQGGST